MSDDSDSDSDLPILGTPRVCGLNGRKSGPKVCLGEPGDGAFVCFFRRKKKQKLVHQLTLI